MTERDYFDDIVVNEPEPVVEGDDAPAESMAEIESQPLPVDLSNEALPAPSGRDAADDIAQREKYERQSGLSGGLPTTRPEDPTVQWSPRPGIVGCDAKGYHKIR